MTCLFFQLVPRLGDINTPGSHLVIQLDKGDKKVGSSRETKKVLGFFCVLNAVALGVGALRFWTDDNGMGTGLALKMLAITSIILALASCYLSCALITPKRFVRFWKWWDQG